MAVQRLENAPLADRARRAILDAIREKRFHGRLPTEEVLAEMLNVSRTTIRSALQSLEQDGIITRKRAVGTTINAHVRPSTLALERLVGFDGLLKEKGYSVRATVDWSIGAPPPYMVEVFGLDPKEEFLITEKAYFAGRARAISIQDAIPREHLKTEDFEDPVPVSLFEFADRYSYRKVAHAVVELVAQVKRDDSTTRLAVGLGEPFTRLHETHYTSGGEESAFSVVDVDNAFITFEVFRRR